MSMFDNGMRIIKRGKDTTIMMIVEGRIVSEFEPDDTKPAPKPGLYDFDGKFLGTEAEDGSLIPAPAE